jgi:streptogramin lyase
VTVDTIHPVVGGFHHLTPMGTTHLVERTMGAGTYYQNSMGETLGRLDPLTGNVTNALGGLAFRFR